MKSVKKMFMEFESFMNNMEVTATRKVMGCGCRVCGIVCKAIARVYLRKERVADFNKNLHKAVGYRMAYATWSHRANRMGAAK